MSSRSKAARRTCSRKRSRPDGSGWHRCSHRRERYAPLGFDLWPGCGLNRSSCCSMVLCPDCPLGRYMQIHRHSHLLPPAYVEHGAPALRPCPWSLTAPVQQILVGPIPGLLRVLGWITAGGTFDHEPCIPPQREVSPEGYTHPPIFAGRECKGRRHQSVSRTAHDGSCRICHL